VAARFENFVKLLRPETCARIDVEDVASLVLFQCVRDILQGIVYDAKSVSACATLSLTQVQHTT
jgi:hypothetical protein